MATTEISSPVGNMAAMREALNEIRVAAMSDYEWDADYLIEKCNAALSAPLRNCDVGTLTEQQQRFRDFCEKMQHTDKACCGGCPIVHLRVKGIIGNSCEIAWAQMPYEEGAANEK